MNIITSRLTSTAYPGRIPEDLSKEDDAREAFRTARAQFGSKHLTMSPFSHQDILAKMYEVQGSSTYSSEYRDTIWADFKTYQTARDEYRKSFNEKDLENIQKELREIDPALLGEKRYEESTSTIKRLILNVFYGIRSCFTSTKLLSRYQGRIEIAKEEVQKEERNEKVKEIFNRHILDKDHPETPQAIDEVLTCMQFLDQASPIYKTYKEAEANIFRELQGVHSCVDLLFNRPLLGPVPAQPLYHMEAFIRKNQHLIAQSPSSQPEKKKEACEEEFFSCEEEEDEVFYSCEEESFPYEEELKESGQSKQKNGALGSDRQEQPGDVTPDDEESDYGFIDISVPPKRQDSSNKVKSEVRQKSSTEYQGELMAKLIDNFDDYQRVFNVLKNNIFPISFIQQIEVEEKQLCSIDVKYTSSLEGTSSTVSSPGKQDFANARLIAKQEDKITVSKNSFCYTPGAVKMGIVVKDYGVYLKKMSWLVQQAVLGVLKAYPNGIQLTLDIDALKIDETTGKIFLLVTPNFKKDEQVEMKTAASSVPESLHERIRTNLTSVSFTEEEFIATFGNLTWTPLTSS